MSAVPLELLGAGGSRIRIGYRTPGIKRELDARGRCVLARELGMQVIEPQFHPERDIGSQDVRPLRLAADAEGISIPSLGCELPLTDPENSQLMPLVDELLTAVEGLGATSALCGVKLPAANVAQKDTWAVLVERARKVCERFGKAGLRFGFEPDHGTFIHTAERLQRLVALVDHPACCANFDACNLYVGGSDPVAAVTHLAGRIISGHIKDGIFRTDRHGEVPLGEGEVPWQEILYALQRTGHSVTMFFEHFGTVANLRVASGRLRGILDLLAAEPVPARADFASPRQGLGRHGG